ncbi:MAG: dehydrogenase [Bacteroidales bacterium]|nr:dehydrogenase [Bacteroidales bacterium]
MKKMLWLVAMGSLLGSYSCKSGAGEASVCDSDSVAAAVDTVPLPDTVFASVDRLDWKVYVTDSTRDGNITDFSDPYQASASHLTFRGNLLRNADFGGKVKGTPSRIVTDWVFETDVDMTPSNMGVWGGGTGWTGQPLYVEWPAAMVAKFKATPSARLTADFAAREIMVASLCGKVHFINFETGKASREALVVDNPVKGTPSIDPRLNGMAYVGHGVQVHAAVSQNAVDLLKHEVIYRNPGYDARAARRWPACDSSPIYVDGFVFWPSENGLIYKYDVADGRVTLHSTLRYTRRGAGGAGVESSMCVYKNYGYFGDNHGNILCINLSTMKPVWHYDNHDDIDGSLVCEVVDGHPYVYTACEVDRQGLSGQCYMAKLDGLTGEAVWEMQVPCTKHNVNNKHFDGGMYGTPLLGSGDCSKLLFTTLANDGQNGGGHFYAIERATGKIVYKTPLRHYAWSSPVGFLNEKNQLFIVVGDTYGSLYLIEGKSGNIIFREKFGDNFESSPVVVGNALVVGSRGTNIFKVHVE